MRKILYTGILFLTLAGIINISSCSNPASTLDSSRTDIFIKDLKHKTFRFFWDQVDRPTGQISDRFPDKRFTSIAATGFGLTSYLVGIENDFITRDEGAERVSHTLNWLWNSKQGSETSGITGFHGFFYHFLNYGEGTRYKNVELSTIDTGWLMAGILACQSYFNMDNPVENRIRNLCDSLYLRVEWDWAMNGQEHMSMGWHPEAGFIKSKWEGYNEAMMIIIMAIGSPTHPISDSAWESWCKSYIWDNFYGYEHVNFSPLFGHQYSHMFIDFRGITDPFMREKGIDYFENSKRATLANRAYCIANPGKFKSYSENIWGLTACDGPGLFYQVSENTNNEFWGYRARGASFPEIIDDGTIAPTAAGGSIPFAPEECIKALYAMKEMYGDSIYNEYGFKDAFNMTFIHPETKIRGWFDRDYLGIDQGPILIQLENYQSGLIWNLLKKNKYMINGLVKAGFSGGWLNEIKNSEYLTKNY